MTPDASTVVPRETSPASRPALPPAVTGEAPLPRDWPLRHGGHIAAGAVRYRLYGEPGADRPVVAVLGGISAGRHVTACTDAPRAGWWEAMVGPARPIDPARWPVLAMEWVDGLAPDGTVPADERDPVHAIDTTDQADAIVMLLDHLDIARLHAVVGSSYGAMVALALASRHPSRVARVVAISGAHRSHPMATALRALQRDIVRLGQTSGLGRDAVRLARALAMTTYRTAEEFAVRFDDTPTWTPEGPRFPVEAYLAHMGEKFTETFSPARFLRLSTSLDLHDVDPATVTTPTTLIAIENDTLVPLWQMRELRDGLAGPATFHELASPYGHDAFLKEIPVMGGMIVGALEGGGAGV